MTIATPKFSLAAYASGNPSAAQVALVLPGFLDTVAHPHIRAHVDALAECGYYAVAFDAPGVWGSAGTIADYTMTNWLAAIREMVEHLGGRPTLTMGHSRGGAMAMLAALRVPQVVGFAAIMSKPNYGADAETVHPLAEWQAAGEREFWVTIPGRPGHKQHFVVPYSVMADAATYDLRAELARCAKPKLFIAGARDTVIRPEVVRVAYELSADPKNFASVDADHLYRRSPESIAAVNAHLTNWVQHTPWNE